jgi:hypothetical protein
MKLVIEIDCGDDAIQQGGLDEITRILTDLTERLPLSSGQEGCRVTLNLHDVNGNHVGTAKLTD